MRENVKMIVTIFFIVLFVAALTGMCISSARLVMIPKENREERLKYKILLGVCIFVLAIYLAFAVFIAILIGNIAVNGM